VRFAAIFCVAVALAGCKKHRQEAPPPAPTRAPAPAPSVPSFPVEACTREAIEAKLVGAELQRFKDTNCLPPSLEACVHIVPFPCLE
jgi:hypothetical protein